MVKTWTTHLVDGSEMIWLPWKTVCQLIIKLDRHIVSDPAILTLSLYATNKQSIYPRKTCMKNVHSSFYNSWKWKKSTSTKKDLDKWKTTVRYIEVNGHAEDYCLELNEQIPCPCNHMNEYQKHYVGWKESILWLYLPEVLE